MPYVRQAQSPSRILVLKNEGKNSEAYEIAEVFRTGGSPSGNEHLIFRGQLLIVSEGGHAVM
jgi:hypothetical protein